MNSSANTSEQQRQFLEEMAIEYSFTGDACTAFLYRFHPKNQDKINQVLTREILWNRNPADKTQKLQDELDKICEVLRQNGCLIEKPKRGRQPKGKSPWEQAYKWLWEIKFPEWQKTQNIVIPGKQVQKEAVCRFLEQITNDFQHIQLFHTSRPIIIKDQYIPIQVTLKRKYTHTFETTWSYAESDAELSRAYSLKHLEETQRTQVDWTEAKKQHRCMMVLADPGMGKTTLLKREAYLIAQEERQRLEDNNRKIEDVVIPLFLRLSEIAKLVNKVEEEVKLIDAILKLLEEKYEKYFPEIRIFLEEKLKAGKCLLLLDALDEVLKENKKLLSEKLNAFYNNYPCSIICTSRIVGYGGAFLASLEDVEIVPFTQKQTNQYIKVWFENAAEYLNDASVSAASLIRELQNKPQIRGLVQNPLLLSLICSLYQEKVLTLPARRCEVYEQAVNCILGKWRKARNPELDDSWVDAKIELLEQIAYQFSCDNKEIFTLRELRSKIDKFLKCENISSDFRNINASVLIAELSEQDGILQKLHENGDQYLFLHRTFQEYLTACYLQRSTDGVELAKAHFWDYEWHETLSLMAGLMKNPIPLLELISIEKDDIFSTQLLLSGRCAAECQGIEHPLIEEIINRIYDFCCRYQGAEFITSVVVMLGQTYAQMFEKLQTDLKHENNYVKFFAALALEKIGSNKAVVALINALGDEDESVKNYAAEALGKIGSDKAVVALINALGDEDESVKNYAAEALGKIGSDKAVDALIKALGDEDAKCKAAEALENIDSDKEVDDIIINYLCDESVRRYAAEALGKIGSDKAVDALIKALGDEDVKRYAAEALGNIGGDKAVDALIKALGDEDVKRYAAEALGNIGGDKAVDALIKALGDESVRRYAAEALGNIGGDKAVNALIKALDDENWDVKCNAAEALGKIGSDKAVDTLINALFDENWLVKMDAAEVLGKIGSDKAIDALINALDDENWLVKMDAAEVLGKIGSDKAIDALINALDNENANVKMHAAEALGKIGSDKAIDALINALDDENANVKMHAAEALGKIGSDKAVDALINALGDESVKGYAAEALGNIGSDKAVDSLIKALADEYEDVKRCAAEALGNIGGDKAVNALINALGDESVKGYAAEALENIGSLKPLAKLIQQPELLNDFNIFLLARKFAIKFSKEKVLFIPVYPELLGKTFEL